MSGDFIFSYGCKNRASQLRCLPGVLFRVSLSIPVPDTWGFCFFLSMQESSVAGSIPGGFICSGSQMFTPSRAGTVACPYEWFGGKRRTASAPLINIYSAFSINHVSGNATKPSCWFIARIGAFCSALSVMICGAPRRFA